MSDPEEGTNWRTSGWRDALGLCCRSAAGVREGAGEAKPDTEVDVVMVALLLCDGVSEPVEVPVCDAVPVKLCVTLGVDVSV